MEELIRTRVLSGEEKKRYDENYVRIFGDKKPIGMKKAVFNKHGILIRYNYPLGEEKCKIIRPTFSNRNGFDPKQMDGLF